MGNGTPKDMLLAPSDIRYFSDDKFVNSAFPAVVLVLRPLACACLSHDAFRVPVQRNRTFASCCRRLLHFDIKVLSLNVEKSTVGEMTPSRERRIRLRSQRSALPCDPIAVMTKVTSWIRCDKKCSREGPNEGEARLQVQGEFASLESSFSASERLASYCRHYMWSQNSCTRQPRRLRRLVVDAKA